MRKAFIYNVLIVLGILVFQMIVGFIFGAAFGVTNAETVVNSTVADVAVTMEGAMKDNTIVNLLTTISGVAMVLSILAFPITIVLSVIGLIKDKAR